jgi:alditol oxidase
VKSAQVGPEVLTFAFLFLNCYCHEKRTFIKLSSTLMSAPLLSPLLSFMPGKKLKNWAGNLEYSTSNLYEPSSVEEVVALVKKYPKIKVLGTRHCFNTIADSKDNFISLKKLDRVLSFDEQAHTVTIEAGLNYGQLCPVLHGKGLALHNLASLPHISVAGACTTATHGSGMNNGNLSTAVVGIEFVTAAGKTISLHRAADGEKFNAAVVGLGGIGIITKLTLDVQPAYQVAQQVFEHLPMQELYANFESIMSAGYSVSLFTDWQTNSVNEVWIKSKVPADGNAVMAVDFFGATAANKNLHPIASVPAENCTEQMGVPGNWYKRLPHFKMGFTPSSGVELQSEYFIPREHAVKAIKAAAKLGAITGPHLFISEIRSIAADNYWMSPCYHQPSIALHFTWKQEWEAVQKILPQLETVLAPFHAKPHWGKLFTMAPAQLASLYEKLPAFRSMLREYDPAGKFRNAFLDKYIYSV